MNNPSSTNRPTVTLAARRWSHLMPLARGTVRPSDVDLRLDQRDETPDGMQEADLDAAETSFSRYVRGLAEGERRRVALPAFVMRGFRHRCYLVPEDSDVCSLTDLRGRSVGLTGWPDSGNTWARSLLRRAGVEIEEVKWTLAPLEGGSLSAGRVGQRVPPNVQVGEPGVSLLDGLAQGRLDAIVAPFVPTQMRTSAGPLRHLLPAYETEEADYFMNTQFVPGIHLVTLRRDLCEAHPWLPDAVVRALEQSKQQWWHERARYADTTPWMLQDFQRTSATFGDDWMPYGVEANRAMVGTFCTELAEQGLTDMQVSAEDVFADYAMFAQAADSGQEVQS